MSEREFNEIFSERLRYYLNKYDMTQLELAKRLGVGPTSVYNWCNAVKTPRMDKVDAMCQIFHCKRSDLMEEKNENEHTIAAHFDGSEYTEEEINRIKEFAEFIKSKRTIE